MKEFQDLVDLFPYCLFVMLPVFILISPLNPCEAAHEFPVHRLAHFEMGNSLYGSKIAAISMEARAKTAAKVLRKLVVATAEDLSISTYNDLAHSGAGGILLLVPSAKETLSKEALEIIYSFEEHSLNGEMEVPVYYAQESPELLDLLNDLNQVGSNGDQTSGAQALIDGIVSNGFQLVSSASNPKAIPEQSVVSLQANLNGISKSGLGEEDSLPTIVVTAHYDAAGGAPGMSYGADSNGSGVTILLELARLWSQIYKSVKSKPNYNLVFLLSGGGKINYLGTKRWLDEQKEDQSSELLANLKMAVCLDSLGLENDINVHVSKPPKEGTVPHLFLASLQNLAKTLFDDVKVNLVHKKINLANEFLAWEHERFSIHKLSALTLSHFENAHDVSRSSILDTNVDDKVVLRNTQLIAEALVCTIYNLGQEQCFGDLFSGSMSPSQNSLEMWMKELTTNPRATGLLIANPKNPTSVPLIKTLTDSLKVITDDVKIHQVKREKRDPEFTFFDQQSDVIMNAYRVKPAVFDLVLTLSIAAYLGLVYLTLMKWNMAFNLLAAFTISKNSGKSEINGNSKLKAH